MLGANRRRIEWIDAARGLAMCMIVFGHSVPGGFLKQLCYTFHVAVFFFLSGLVFHGDRQENFRSFFVKEFKNLILPYYGASIFSIGIYLLFGKMVSSELHISVKEGGFFRQLAGMFYGNCKTGYMKWNLPLWFLPCLFSVVLMAWCILKGVNKVQEERKVLILLGVICFLIIFGIYLTDKWQVAMLPLGLETGIRMFPFFLAGTGTGWILNSMQNGIVIDQKAAGGYLTECKTAKQAISKIVLVTVLLMCLGICAFSAAKNSLVLYHRDDYGSEILFYLGAVSGICLMIPAGILLEKCQWLCYIGRHTMVILLFHKFPILFFQVLVPNVGQMLEESNIVAGLSVSGFAILSCLILEILVKRVRKRLFS